MELFEIALVASLIILLVIFMSYYAKSKHRFVKILFGICSGVAFLFPVKLILVYFGYQFSINIITLCISSILGIPGVALMAAIAII